jgi:hypothetical protein
MRTQTGDTPWGIRAPKLVQRPTSLEGCTALTRTATVILPKEGTPWALADCTRGYASGQAA